MTSRKSTLTASSPKQEAEPTVPGQHPLFGRRALPLASKDDGLALAKSSIEPEVHPNLAAMEIGAIVNELDDIDIRMMVKELCARNREMANTARLLLSRQLVNPQGPHVAQVMDCASIVQDAFCVKHLMGLCSLERYQFPDEQRLRQLVAMTGYWAQKADDSAHASLSLLGLTVALKSILDGQFFLRNQACQLREMKGLHTGDPNWVVSNVESLIADCDRWGVRLADKMFELVNDLMPSLHRKETAHFQYGRLDLLTELGKITSQYSHMHSTLSVRLVTSSLLEKSGRVYWPGPSGGFHLNLVAGRYQSFVPEHCPTSSIPIWYQAIGAKASDIPAASSPRNSPQKQAAVTLPARVAETAQNTGALMLDGTRQASPTPGHSTHFRATLQQFTSALPPLPNVKSAKSLNKPASERIRRGGSSAASEGPPVTRPSTNRVDRKKRRSRGGNKRKETSAMGDATKPRQPSGAFATGSNRTEVAQRRPNADLFEDRVLPTLLTESNCSALGPVRTTSTASSQRLPSLKGDALAKVEMRDETEQGDDNNDVLVKLEQTTSDVIGQAP